MDKEDMRCQMEAIRDELTRNEEEHKALMDMLRGYEAWFRLHSKDNSQQLAMKVGKASEVGESRSRGGKPLGDLSFRKGLIAVLTESRGEPLVDTEIWGRMQTVGVRSKAKNPVGFISMTARQVPHIEKLDSHTYRWIGNENGRQ